MRCPAPDAAYVRGDRLLWRQYNVAFAALSFLYDLWPHLTGRSHSRPVARNDTLKETVMDEPEPPSSRARSKSSLFFIGKDSCGNWVVQDQQHLCGGLFIDRAAALRFAMFENGNRPQAVVMVPGIFELDLSGKSSVVVQPTVLTDAPLARRIRQKVLSFLPNPTVVPV
jgi:hypothetical protein